MLLYNNRWICLLPFARKPDPRRVSKQVSREPPQAWLFGLVRLAPQAERTKSAAGRRKAPQASQFSAPQAEKIRGVLRSPCSSRSGFACAALAEQQHVPPLVIHKGPREGKSLLQKRLCCFSFSTRAMRKGGAPRPSPAPKRGNSPDRPSVALWGRRRWAPAVPQRGTFRKKWLGRSAAGGSWGL